MVYIISDLALRFQKRHHQTTYRSMKTGLTRNTKICSEEENDSFLLLLSEKEQVKYSKSNLTELAVPQEVTQDDSSYASSHHKIQGWYL